MAGIYAGDNPYVLANPATRMWESIDYLLNMADFQSYVDAEYRHLAEASDDDDFHPYDHWHHAVKDMATNDPGSKEWKRGAAHLVRKFFPAPEGEGARAEKARDTHAERMSDLFKPATKWKNPDYEQHKSVDTGGKKRRVGTGVAAKPSREETVGHPPIHRIAQDLHTAVLKGKEPGEDDLRKMVSAHLSKEKMRAQQKQRIEKKHISGSIDAGSGSSDDEGERAADPSDDRTPRGAEKAGKITPPHATAATQHDHWLGDHPYVKQHLGKGNKKVAGSRQRLVKSLYDKHRETMGHKEAIAHIHKGLDGDLSKSEIDDHLAGVKPKVIPAGGGPRLSPTGGKLRVGEPAKNVLRPEESAEKKERVKKARGEVMNAFKSAVASGAKKVKNLPASEMTRNKSGIQLGGGKKADADDLKAARRGGARALVKIGRMALSRAHDRTTDRDDKPVDHALTAAGRDPEVRMRVGHEVSTPEPSDKQLELSKKKGETPEKLKKRLDVQHNANARTAVGNLFKQTGIHPGVGGTERLAKAERELMHATGKKVRGMGGDPAEATKAKREPADARHIRFPLSKKWVKQAKYQQPAPKSEKEKTIERLAARRKERQAGERRAELKARADARVRPQPKRAPAGEIPGADEKERGIVHFAKLRGEKSLPGGVEAVRRRAYPGSKPTAPNKKVKAAPEEFKKVRTPYKRGTGEVRPLPKGVGTAKPRFDKPVEESLAVRCGLTESRRLSLAERVLR